MIIRGIYRVLEMGNQHPMVWRGVIMHIEDIRTAARNLYFGDGYFWRHPECVNYKGIWTSTDMDWLETKLMFFKELCCEKIFLARKAGTGCGYPSKKDCYGLRTYVHPVFTE